MDMSYGNWGLQAEYARKGQDPSIMNHYIYRKGEALMLNATYSQKGFSANLQAKRIDNMCFKSSRSESGEMLYINYIPAITKQHTYAFLNMYPYATQTTGEMGLQGDVMYKIKKGTLLGGKYGTDIHFNGAVITGLDTNHLFMVQNRRIVLHRPLPRSGQETQFCSQAHLHLWLSNLQPSC